jgi:hypothetical protein
VFIHKLPHCAHFLEHTGRWKYALHKWARWPQGFLGKLVLDPSVKLYAPLICDGEGKVIVQRGVIIGTNLIVRPNAIVISTIPPNTLAGGIPARVFRNILAP